MKEFAHEALRKGQCVATLTTSLDIPKRSIRKGVVLSSTKETLLMKETKEQYVSAADVAALIRSNASRLEAASPHGRSRGVPGFKLKDLEKVPMHYFRAPEQAPTLEADVEVAAREEIELGQRAVRVAEKIVDAAKKGDLTAEHFVDLMAESEQPDITARALRMAKAGESTIISPLVPKPYFADPPATLSEEAIGGQAHRVRIEIVGPVAGEHLKLRARVVESKENNPFWIKVGSNAVIIEEPDDVKYKLLLLSTLMPTGIDVELSVRVPLSMRRAGDITPLATIISAIDAREIVAGVISQLGLQLELFK